MEFLKNGATRGSGKMNENVKDGLFWLLLILGMILLMISLSGGH